MNSAYVAIVFSASVSVGSPAATEESGARLEPVTVYGRGLE